MYHLVATATVSYRSLDATLELFRSVFMNDGSNIHRGIHRITAFELFGSFEHLLRKFVRDRFHAKDSLDRRATLARILGRIQYRQLSRLFEVGVFHDNQRIVSAEFENETLVTGGSHYPRSHEPSAVQTRMCAVAAE